MVRWRRVHRLWRDRGLSMQERLRNLFAVILFLLQRLALNQTQMKNLLSSAVCLLAAAFAPAVAQDDCEFEAQVEFYTAMWGGEISWESPTMLETLS